MRAGSGTGASSRSSTSSATGSSSCTWTSTSCRGRSIPFRSGRRAGRRPLASAARTSWATRSGRWPSAPATRSRPRPEPPGRPGAPARQPALPRPLFNPVSFYYCFDSDWRAGQAVVADVNNIPWGERHPYVLARGEREGPVLSDRARQEPPRLAADGDGPDLRLPRRRARRAARRPHRVAASARRAPWRRAKPRPKSFDATLSLRRRELSRAAAAGDACPLPGDVAAGGGEDLRAVAAAEAEGRALLPPPAGSKPKGFVSP